MQFYDGSWRRLDICRPERVDDKGAPSPQRELKLALGGQQSGELVGGHEPHAGRPVLTAIRAEGRRKPT
ncbi:MAG: hypothetical protein QOH16_670 [Gaiellaceae bacterium]|nr:hypothetical protein [Gaiellaceae bacterium]